MRTLEASRSFHLRILYQALNQDEDIGASTCCSGSIYWHGGVDTCKILNFAADIGQLKSVVKAAFRLYLRQPYQIIWRSFRESDVSANSVEVDPFRSRSLESSLFCRTTSVGSKNREALIPEGEQTI